MMSPNAETLKIEMYPDGRLNAKNAAIYTGYSVKTLAMKRCKGDGPRFIKMGYIYYFRADLDAWIDAQGKQTSTAQQLHKRHLNIVTVGEK